MNLKKIQKALITALLAIGLVSGSVTAASATTGGGTGGGGSTGQQSGFYWASVSSSSAGTAYNQFLSKTGLTRSFAESQVSQRVGNTSVCQNSDVIWFLMGPQIWAYNFQGYPTWYTHWMFRGSIQYPTSLYGPGPTAAQYQHFIDWDNGIGGKRRFNQGMNGSYGYTIVCSYATYRPTTTRYSYPTPRVVSTPTEAKFTEPYSWTTEITRQPLAGDGGKDPIGANNLHNQLVDKKSNFGLLWDSLQNSSTRTPQQLKDAVNTALDKDKTLAHGTTALDDDNKAGMAEGGVLNVKEQTLYATVQTNEVKTVTTPIRCVHTATWNSGLGRYNAETTSCSDMPSSTTYTRSTTKTTGTQQNTGFWQMLAVHCNQAEFNALLASDSSLQKITTPDSTNAISGSVITKNYGTQPAKLDFGDSTNTNAAKAKTGKLAFFDKECPFDCTPDATSSGASTNNGATGNVGSAGSVLPALFGATSNGSNTNAFEFFRDNAAKNVKVDTWYPKAVNGVTYGGEAPITTTITRDPNGTPSLTGSSGGKFTMNSAKGDALFTGSSTNVATQKNWDSSTYSGSNATILKGLHNSFNLKATWASDAGKPHAFNFKWEYAPTVTTTVPLSSIGFGALSTQNSGTKGAAATTIEGKCYSWFGTTTSSSTVAEFGANTGTGTTNTLDGSLLTGTKGTAAKLTANFVRSTTE